MDKICFINNYLKRVIFSSLSSHNIILSISFSHAAHADQVKRDFLQSASNSDKLKQTDAAAVNQQISIQKDSRPSEFSRPLTLFTL